MEEAGADGADVEGTRSTVVVVEEDGGADLSLKVSCAGVRETLEGGGRLVFRDLRLFFEVLSAEDSRIPDGHGSTSMSTVADEAGVTSGASEETTLAARLLAFFEGFDLEDFCCSTGGFRRMTT